MNAALAAIDGMRPADEIEAMLAVQMVATHGVAMDMLDRAKRADRMPILQESGSLAVKLLRTYTATAQVEALARLRRGGEQRNAYWSLIAFWGGCLVANLRVRPQKLALDQISVSRR
jgi:hypothetical protein